MCYMSDRVNILFIVEMLPVISNDVNHWKKTSEKHNYAQSMDPKLINVIKSVTF